MAEFNPEYEVFKKEAEGLIAELVKKLEQSNFTNVELAQLAAEIDFFFGGKGGGCITTAQHQIAVSNFADPQTLLKKLF